MCTPSWEDGTNFCSNAGGSFKAGLLVAERVLVYANGVGVSRLMGRHVKILQSKGGKPESGKSIEITAAYGEEDMHIDAGRLLNEDASSYSLPSTGMDF